MLTPSGLLSGARTRIRNRFMNSSGHTVACSQAENGIAAVPAHGGAPAPCRLPRGRPLARAKAGQDKHHPHESGAEVRLCSVVKGKSSPIAKANDEVLEKDASSLQTFR